MQASIERITSVAELIGTPETAAAFFKLAMATGDTEFVLRSMHVLAHSKGMADALAWAGLSCDYLRRALDKEGQSLMHALRDVSQCLSARLDLPTLLAE